MKHVTAPFLELLGTTTSKFNPLLFAGKITLMLLFLTINQTGVVAQSSCNPPTVSDASATLPSVCNTIPDITGQSGSVIELTINPANKYTFTLCYAGTPPNGNVFPQADIWDELNDATALLASTGSATNQCTSVSYAPSTAPGSVCASANSTIFLATYDHQCASNWNDIEISVTCEGCELECGSPAFVTASNSGCSANAFDIDGPDLTGSCAGNDITFMTNLELQPFVSVLQDMTAGAIVFRDDEPYTFDLDDSGIVSFNSGAPTGTHTISFTVIDCAGNTTTCQQSIIIEPVMACDDVVNVTLSQFCELQVTPGMLLEAECADDSQYTVNILGQTNDIISEPGLYEVQIVYDPTVENSASGNFCWGFINAEDKSGPTCTIENEQINVSCGEDFDAGMPEFNDCSGVASTEMITIEVGDCGDLTFPHVVNSSITIPAPDPTDAAYIELNAAGFILDRVTVNMWTATDNNGMSSNSCQQYIYTWRPSTVNPPLTSITVECGSDIDQSTLAALDPQYVPFYDNPKYGMDTDLTNDLEFTKVDNDGDLQFLPITDVDHSICKFTVSSNDELLQELCGTTNKYIREFTVLNWCTGEFIEGIIGLKQVIKTEDTTAPEITNCPGADEQGGSFENPNILYTSSSAAGECGFTGTFTPPTATDGCSNPISFSANIFTSGGTGTGYVLVTQVQDLSNNVTLDLRDYRVDFIATDDCDNTSEPCSVFYNIVDNDSPAVICDQHTTVSLTNIGTAEICADNLDSGSSDNCGIASRMIRRMNAPDSTFAECLSLDCMDAGQEIMIVLRVADAAGNSNTCMVMVDVEDKSGPSIVCPSDTTITCLESTDVANTGDILLNTNQGDGFNGYAFDNCNINAVNNDTTQNIDCGIGTIEREFTAFTNTGIATCVQTITVEPDFNYFVTFPVDVTIGCEDVANTDEVGEPIITGVTCAEIGTSVEDQTFVISNGACVRILRTYIIKNTCIHDDQAETTDGGYPVDGEALKFQDDGDGYFKYVQKIDIVDEEAPVLTIENQFFDTFNDDCTGNVNVDFSATDNCNSEMTYSWRVDLFSDGSNDEFGNDSSINDVYPVGTHTAFVQVFDGCGNTDTESFTITMSDRKNPTIICTDLNSVIMNGDANSVTLWATDFIVDGSVLDNCTPSFDLVVTAAIGASAGLEAENAATNIVVTCDMMDTDADGNAIPTEFPVMIFVTDAAGNSDFCATTIEVIDTGNDCGGFGAGSSAVISGRIYNEQDEDVEDVMVEVQSSAMSMNPYMTDANGQFQFGNLATNNDYSVLPSKDINPSNGISTFDLVLLTRHILGLEQLNSPYKMIAADVNEDRVLDIRDLIELRQLILFSITEFASERSWRFIDADYQFNNPANPLAESYPEVIDFANLTSNVAADFIGIKIGDLDGDSYANRLLDVTPRSLYPTANINVSDADIVAGEAVNIPFSIENMNDVSAMQFTVSFDQNVLDFTGVSAGALNVSEGNFGFTMIDEGVLTFSWSSASGKEVSIESNDIFNLEFAAKQAGSIAKAINVNSKYTNSIAFNDNGRHNIELNLTSQNGTLVNGQNFELYQNQPNPFKNNTIIGFNLPEAASATLRILDVTGKELRVITNNYERGYNKIDLDLNSLNARGVLYYQLETASHAATMKMIVIE